MSFLEEMWSRNLSNLMISPLRPIEFVCALMIMSLVRLAIGMVPVTFLAIAFFGFNVYSLGLALAAFFMNLILTSWAVGIVVSGVAAQRDGGGVARLDLDVRADAAHLRLLSRECAAGLAAGDRLDAAAHLRVRRHAGAHHEHVFRADLMVAAFALNALYFAAAVIAFLQLLKSSRRIGSLLQAGE